MTSVAMEEIASVSERAFAVVIDALLLTLMTVIFVGTLGQAGMVIALVFSFLYHWYCWTHFTGQTPGKKIINIRIVKANGSEVNDIDAVVRYFACWVSILTLGLGWLLLRNDARRQGLHDKIAGTVVVKNYSISAYND